ncbi:MAG TPA: zf-HC2 domain-containing protein [Thermoanaerobaculia bacterium]|nr:zf-HC2 domain-containing protein [Thermoanaerobaculia bacterium]
MHEREDHDERIHQRIWELLPWYVNGTLSEADRERVEDHSAVCRRCRDEIETCRQTSEAIQGLGEVAPSPHPVQLQRVLARIDEAEQAEKSEWQEQRAGRRPFGLPLRAFQELIAATPRPLRGALMAQVAIIVLLVGVLVWTELRTVRSPAVPGAPVIYQTLSDSAPAQRPGGTVALRMMFSRGATEKEIRDLLLAVHGEITAGPSPFGAYTVEVAAAGHPVSVVLTRLRSDSAVALAEPVAGSAPAKGTR